MMDYQNTPLPSLLPSFLPSFFSVVVKSFPLEAQVERGMGAAGIQRKGRMERASLGMKKPSRRRDLREEQGVSLPLPVKSSI